MSSPKMSRLKLVRDEIVEAFSDEALAMAESVSEAELLSDANRIDLTALPTITIDDADTQDRGRRLSLERLDDEGGGAGEISTWCAYHGCRRAHSTRQCPR